MRDHPAHISPRNDQPCGHLCLSFLPGSGSASEASIALSSEPTQAPRCYRDTPSSPFLWTCWFFLSHRAVLLWRIPAPSDGVSPASRTPVRFAGDDASGCGLSNRGISRLVVGDVLSMRGGDKSRVGGTTTIPRMMVLLSIVGIFIGLWLTDWLRRVLMGDQLNGRRG